MKSMDYLTFLTETQAYLCVSGREKPLGEFLLRSYDFLEEADAVSNIIARKEGCGKDRKTILLEAHLDEIGLVIAGIEKNGFLRVETVGGMDPSLLPGTAFEIFGKKKLFAMVGAKPPHLAKGGEEKKKNDALYLDAGFLSEKEAREVVRIGDVAHFYGPAKRMENGRIVSRGLDNKVAVMTALEAFRRLKDPYHNVVLILSAGEETTSVGVRAYTAVHESDLAIVVDAGFARAEGLDPTHCIEMDQSPSVSITDTLENRVSRWAIRLAREKDLPCQVISEPGGTGTSGTAIQTSGGGVPSVLISIPILNMHTPSEIVSVKDLDAAVDLLHAMLGTETLPTRKETLLERN